MKVSMMVLMLLCFNAICFADGKDAVKALMKIQARTQTGVSFKDYAPLIGDAKLEINLFEKSEEAAKNPELMKSLNNAMSHYRMAGSVWSTKFGKYGRSRLDAKDKLAAVIFNAYPDANKDEKEGGLVHNGDVWIDKATSYIWKEADKEIDKATGLIGKR